MMMKEEYDKTGAQTVSLARRGGMKELHGVSNTIQLCRLHQPVQSLCEEGGEVGLSVLESHRTCRMQHRPLLLLE